MNAISFAHPQPARPIMSGALVRDSLWAGLLGGSAMAAAGVLLAEISGYDGWFPLKALGSLVLGPSALSASAQLFEFPCEFEFIGFILALEL